MREQVRAVSTDRLHGRIGELPGETMKQLDDALRLHLAL
nr:type II toxin-antitoxin system PemK/MazF family toxin [Kutzneria chonburiensis]